MGLHDGKVALVTGAGGGLGRAHAMLLAQEGAAVIVNDLGGEVDGTGSGTAMADGVVAEINAAGGSAVADYGSVTRADSARGMVQRAVDSFGKLDICILNAGILLDRSLKKMTDEMWDRVLEVHLRGTYLVGKAAYDQMLAQGTGGRVVVTSSTSGLFGNFGQSNYGAAKAGIAGFARCMAFEGAKYGITVNVLAPMAYTRFSRHVMPAHAVGQITPEKVASTVAWLCSDEAGDVTGRIFSVAGNKVVLLEWQAVPIAERPHDQQAWSVADIGQRIRESVGGWPTPVKVEDLV